MNDDCDGGFFIAGLFFGAVITCFMVYMIDNFCNYNDSNRVIVSDTVCSSVKGTLVSYDRNGEVICEVNGMEITTKWK